MSTVSPGLALLLAEQGAVPDTVALLPELPGLAVHQAYLRQNHSYGSFLLTGRNECFQSTNILIFYQLASISLPAEGILISPGMAAAIVALS